MSFQIRVNGLDFALKRKCPLCKENRIPKKPDYVHMSDGTEIPICNSCGDIMDAMHGIRARARDGDDEPV
jgi:hypothetical protein